MDKIYSLDTGSVQYNRILQTLKYHIPKSKKGIRIFLYKKIRNAEHFCKNQLRYGSCKSNMITLVKQMNEILTLIHL